MMVKLNAVTFFFCGGEMRVINNKAMAIIIPVMSGSRKMSCCTVFCVGSNKNKTNQTKNGIKTSKRLDLCSSSERIRRLLFCLLKNQWVAYAGAQYNRKLMIKENKINSNFNISTRFQGAVLISLARSFLMGWQTLSSCFRNTDPTALECESTSFSAESSIAASDFSARCWSINISP